MKIRTLTAKQRWEKAAWGVAYTAVGAATVWFASGSPVQSQKYRDRADDALSRVNSPEDRSIFTAGTNAKVNEMNRTSGMGVFLGAFGLVSGISNIVEAVRGYEKEWEMKASFKEFRGKPSEAQTVEGEFTKE